MQREEHFPYPRAAAKAVPAPQKPEQEQALGSCHLPGHGAEAGEGK